jgi:ATP-dependent RNA helicase DDX49/DBP8
LVWTLPAKAFRETNNLSNFLRTCAMSTLFGKKRKPKLQQTENVAVVVSTTDASTDAAKRQRTESSVDNNDSSIGTTKIKNDGADDTQPEYQCNSFQEMGLVEPLVAMCHQLSWRAPTPVQKVMIPFLLRNRQQNCLVLAATGTGKTASYLLPILHHCSADPYSIYAIVVTPTRELAQQIHQQVLVLGASTYNIQSACIVGGFDIVQQGNTLVHNPPHIVVATPGRLATILRNPSPPRNLHKISYLVFDEADRLLVSSSNGSCGFTADIAEILLHVHSHQTPVAANSTRPQNTPKCQTLLYSATCTSSLETLEALALGSSTFGDSKASLLRKFVISQDYTLLPSTTSTEVRNESEVTIPTTEAITSLPNGLKQEYIFMPDRVRDAYLLATIRELLANGGQAKRNEEPSKNRNHRNRTNSKARSKEVTTDAISDASKAQSAILFVSTCERAAFVSGLMEQVGVPNVTLHSFLSQPRRVAAVRKFQSEQVRILVATDVASRGLDIPRTDLVINVELPRSPVNYIHRVGRTARAGRRGRAVSLVAECDVTLVQTIERTVGRPLDLCTDVTDDMAMAMLGPAAKAARLTKLRLADLNFHELAQKMKERKVRDRKERQRKEKLQQKQAATA